MAHVQARPAEGGPVSVPHNPEAERSVLGQIMSGGDKVAGEVVGSLLEPQHFYHPANRLLFGALVENYYGDDPLDALSVGERVAPELAKAWRLEGPEAENQAIVRVRDMAVGQRFNGSVIDHAKLVKREYDLRELADIGTSVAEMIGSGDKTPEEIGSIISESAMRVATDSLITHELVSFGDVGRRFINRTREQVKLTAAGVELGAYFDMGAIDDWTGGLRPTELLFTAGEPGVGKSALWWAAAERFAERQAKNPPDRRVGALILSLEMGEEPSGVRLAQHLTDLDGRALREGKVTEADISKVVAEWGRRSDLPLWFNYASVLRASQIRAICVEAIRKHNIGLVVIDHFRYFDMDRTYLNKNEEDEDKVRFLKEGLAKDLNLAVICIAHTTKALENTSDGRPKLTHLRGSGQVAADADLVSFMYRPFKYASERAKERGDVKETDAELIWSKNRHGVDGSAEFYFEPATMTIRDRFPGGF